MRFFVVAVILFLVLGLAVPLDGATAPPKSITQVGVDVNYPTPQRFIDNLSSQGVTWIRQYGPNSNTPMIHKAGINDLMVLNENLFYYNPTNFGWVGHSNYTDVRQLTTKQWYGYVYQAAKAMPWITEWEFLNEPTDRPLPSGNGITWTPQQYFEYLVPTYQALKAANAKNMLIGPALLVWPYLCCPQFDSYSISWIQTLWDMTDPNTGLTASAMLTYVSLHVYTAGNMPDDLLVEGPFAGRTIGHAIQQGLEEYHQITGKPLVIDEFGAPSSGAYVAPLYAPADWTPTPAWQSTYYRQIMNVFEATPHVVGVFAFDWADYGQPSSLALGGLFNYGLRQKPAWSVYKQYFSSGSPAIETASASSSNSSGVGATEPVSIQSAWMNGTSFNGIYVKVTSNGVTEASGFTPLNFTGWTGSNYNVTFDYYAPWTYGVVFFDHLSTGVTSNRGTIAVEGPTALTAYYKVAANSSTTTTTSSNTSSSSSSSSASGPVTTVTKTTTVFVGGVGGAGGGVVTKTTTQTTTQTVEVTTTYTTTLTTTYTTTTVVNGTTKTVTSTSTRVATSTETLPSTVVRTETTTQVVSASVSSSRQPTAAGGIHPRSQTSASSPPNSGVAPPFFFGIILAAAAVAGLVSQFYLRGGISLVGRRLKSLSGAWFRVKTRKRSGAD